jgi:hypothetical protein
LGDVDFGREAKKIDADAHLQVGVRTKEGRSEKDKAHSFRWR